MAVEARKVPAPCGNRHLSEHRANGYQQFNPDQWHEAPTADERREKNLLDEMRERGYRISVNCRVCGHPLVAPRSVAAMVGPKCAAKLAEVAG